MTAWCLLEGTTCTHELFHLFLLKYIKKTFYFHRGGRREKEGETSIACLLHTPNSGMWTGNQTRDLLVCRVALNPLSHTSQGSIPYKNKNGPCLVWLSRLSTSLGTKESPVRFPARAHAWVTGQVPSTKCTRDNYTLMFLSLFLLPFPSL